MSHSRHDDRDHLATLMSLICWTPSADDEGHPAGSSCPTSLRDVLDNYRWSMLENGLIDWDIMNGRQPGSPTEAAYRLGMVYVPAVFEGVGSHVDRVLGELIDRPESDAVATALGTRWRADLCATAWRIRLVDRAEERESVTNLHML